MVEILAYADEQGRITPSTLCHASLHALRRTSMALGVALALADAAGRVYAVWDESKHPRDNSGRWAAGSVQLYTDPDSGVTFNVKSDGNGRWVNAQSLDVYWGTNVNPKDVRDLVGGQDEDLHVYYDPDQPRVPKGAEDGGQFTSIGVGQHFKDAPLDGKGAAAWRKKMQKVYDTDPEFRAAADAVTLYTQGSSKHVRALAQQEITGKLSDYWKKSELPKWRNKKMWPNPLTKYSNYFIGQGFAAGKDSKFMWKEGAAALNNAIRTARPLPVPIYRGIWGSENLDKLFAMKAGQYFDMAGPTSFTSSKDIASQFASGTSRGQGGGGLAKWTKMAVIEVVPGARGIGVQALSPWKQQEVLTSGRFKIKSIVLSGNKWGHVVIEQADTFRNTMK